METNLCREIIDQFLFYPSFQKYLKNMLPLISIFIFLNINYFMTQSGFRWKHSCHTALTNLTDRWLKYMDDGNLIATVFLDLKKAFDMVDHKRLCKKLQYYQISTNSMKWFESYLSLQTQNWCIGSNISNPEPVKYGDHKCPFWALCSLLYL